MSADINPHSKRRHALLAGAAALALSAAPRLAVAAEAAATAADTGSGTQVETVIVTARRRSEDIQATPLSVAAVSGAQLQARAAVNLSDIKTVAPNLVFDQVIAGPSAAAIYIRGMGYGDIEKSINPAVGVLVDGVQMGTNTGQLAHSFDFDSVEVLLGPQGTLFGRNTTGGVINIRRTRPTGDWGINLGVTEGNYGRQDYDVVANLPKLAGILSTKLFYDYTGSTGYYHNVTTGKSEPIDIHRAGGATFLLTPTDNFSVQLTGEVTRDIGQISEASLNQTPTTLFPLYDLVCLFAPAIECNRNTTTDLYTTFENDREAYFYDVDAFTGEINWTIGKIKLTSVTGYQNERERTQQDFDATSITFYNADRAERYKQFSEELRAAGPITDNIDFVAGLYYWHSDYNIVWKQLLGAPLGGPYDIDNFTHYDSKSYAVFGDVDWKFLPGWRLSIGGRYTKDTNAMVLTQFIAGAPIGPTTNFTATPPAVKNSDFSPKVSLDWHPTDDIMLYTSYSRGYKAGGLNTRGATIYAADTPFLPEKVWSVELGAKTEWFDRRLIANADIFRSEVTNQQNYIVAPSPPGVTGTNTVVSNAGKETIQGLEVQVLARPTQNLSLHANLGLLDAKYDQFLICNPAVLICTPSTLLNETSLTPVRSPKTTFTIGADYVQPTAIGNWTLSGSYSQVSAYASSIVALPNNPGVNDPIANTQAQHTLDASLSWEPKVAAGKLRLTVYGRNLLDERGLEGGLEASGLFAFGFGREPLTYGVMANYKF